MEASASWCVGLRYRNAGSGVMLKGSLENR
jgi:hypothetical protein